MHLSLLSQDSLSAVGAHFVIEVRSPLIEVGVDFDIASIF